jgi:putative two-component system response regulator
MSKRRKTILIVDDKLNNIKLIEAILKPEGYRTVSVSGGIAALAVVTQQPPDLILLDVMMPDMDGYQVAGKLKHDPITKNIPIIMVTGLSDRNSRLIGLNSGVEEFMLKPVDSAELRMRVKNMLRLKEHSDLLGQHNYILERRVRVRTSELQASHVETIYAMTRAAEHRDDDTGIHVRRISHYSKHLAETLGMDSNYCDMIHYASPMHDIGKIGIPDRILLKSTAHTADETEIMKTHCVLGADILLGCKSPYLKMGAEIALNHHERWDGTGYPAGLAGDAIPQAARIMAICDVYDALRSKRPYKPAFDHDKTMGIIVDGDGRTLPEHFDPAVLDAFKHCGQRFNEIYQAYE